MDIATISSAYQGLKVTKDVLGTLFDAKVDAEAKQKIIDAQARLGEAQDALFSVREELFRLQNENNQLRNQLANAQAWQSQAERYELTETVGGAVVYKYKGHPEHFACPSCYNKKEIHILQDNRTLSGKYRCTGCASEFPVECRQDPNVQPINFVS